MTTTDPSPTGPVGGDAPPAGRPTTGRLSAAGPELALIGWTLFVWVGRIRNVIADEALEGWGRVWRLGLAGGLSSLAVATLVAVILRPVTAGPVRALAAALAGVSSAVWIVRGIDIAIGQHELGFKVVHSVLAIITLALSVMVARHLRSTPADRAAIPAPGR